MEWMEWNEMDRFVRFQQYPILDEEGDTDTDC